MLQKSPILNNSYKLVGLLWLAVALFCWFHKFTPLSYNNYLIFKNVYYHSVAQTTLYGYYPNEYYDLNYYGPTFALFVAPFALLPDVWGFLLWCLASAAVLWGAIHLLPLSKQRRMFIMLFCSLELANTIHDIQFNTFVAAIIIFSFILIERGKDEWATLLIALGTLTKIYPVIGIIFFVFSKNKLRFATSGIVWMAVLFFAPMLLSGKQFVLHSYIEWFDALTKKNLLNVELSTSQDLSFMGVWRHMLNNPGLPNWPFLLFATLMLTIPLLRFKQYQSVYFRMQVLAAALLTVVLFSTASEHSTYVIAVTGAVLWIFLQKQPFTRRNKIILILLIFVTGLGLTEAYPAFIRNEIVTKYVVKAWPCIGVWLLLTFELFFKQFPVAAGTSYLLDNNLSAIKKKNEEGNLAAA